MKTITEIVKIGSGQRYKLYLDDELFGIYESEILARHSLKRGQAFEDEFFESLKFENGDYACFNRGLKVLEKCMKTEKMMKDYLRERNYPSSCIQKAICKMKEYGYINDQAYCESFISSNESGKSKKKMKYDLRAKGVSEDIIDEALCKINDEDEEEKCYILAKKFMKNKEFDIKNKQKLYSHLAGKGYEYGDIAKAWERMTNDRD